MNNWMTWALAIAALVVGYQQYGWQGVLLAITIIVFWLLLMFNRFQRVMKQAAGNRMGHVGEARSLALRLKAGMPLFEVVKYTKSLGQLVRQEPETYRWTDDEGGAVEVVFSKGRTATWNLIPQPPSAGAQDVQATNTAETP